MIIIVLFCEMRDKSRFAIVTENQQEPETDKFTTIYWINVNIADTLPISEIQHNLVNIQN